MLHREHLPVLFSNHVDLTNLKGEVNIRSDRTETLDARCLYISR
jgi:hypothetical protein